MGIPSGDRIILDKFRSAIEDIAFAHGGATIENPSTSDDNDELLGTTRMRIPLQCYDEVAIYLERRGDVELEGIPEAHRKLAELHFQTQGDGEYPESSELVDKGVPEHLASTLTGYQRQGVAFVLSRDGKGELPRYMHDELNLILFLLPIPLDHAFHPDSNGDCDTLLSLNHSFDC